MCRDIQSPTEVPHDSRRYAKKPFVPGRLSWNWRKWRWWWDLTLSTEARREPLLRKYVIQRDGWIACFIKVRLIDDLIDDSLSSQHRPCGVTCRKFGSLVRSLSKEIWDILERKSIERGTVEILTRGYKKRSFRLKCNSLVEIRGRKD